MSSGSDPSTGSSMSARRQLTLGVIIIAILFGGFGGWAVFTQIAGAVIATGRIEVDQNRQVVQHIDGGVVEEIHVRDGDTVSEGDVLIRLDGTTLRSELSIIEGQLFELMARRGRLEAERDNTTSVAFDSWLHELAAKRPAVADTMQGQENLFEARRDSLQREVEQLGKRRSQIQSQLNGIEAQENATDAQLLLIQEELTDQQTLLASGLAQKSRLLALQREEASLSGRIGELIASQAEAEGRITEIDIQVLSLRNQRREEAITELRDIRTREFELAEQRLALLDRIDRLDIRAPLSGIVYDLRVFAERSVIRPADPLLYLIPQNRPLVITTRIQPTNIDQVYPGQEVSLRFSALDARTTPQLLGTVTQISADAFVDEQRGTSYYTAQLILKDGEITRLPEGTVLLPGMPVEAFLRTDDRTPLAYLLKPLSDYFVKAFRET
ncbi:HlyD family type I secretion periplasmic adaptor subunit [Meridianimarinicoccus sp. RP-17]|uniref:HlyD family type I secretion periplasmic adaptor subunit n=1 Tax=Meridianimarinicoccus zhengii TaxID=2056810 RepID=UPI000DAC9E2E|nr:HlyD family type I secretion periplasmic adaptor subunit [Phycocomes zhengii]